MTVQACTSMFAQRLDPPLWDPLCAEIDGMLESQAPSGIYRRHDGRPIAVFWARPDRRRDDSFVVDYIELDGPWLGIPLTMPLLGPDGLHHPIEDRKYSGPRFQYVEGIDVLPKDEWWHFIIEQMIKARSMW